MQDDQKEESNPQTDLHALLSQGAVAIDIGDDIPVDGHFHYDIDIQELFAGPEPDYEKIGKILGMHFNPNTRAVSSLQHASSIRKALEEFHNHDPNYLPNTVKQIQQLREEKRSRGLSLTPQDIHHATKVIAARVYKHDLDEAASTIDNQNATIEQKDAIIKIQKKENALSWGLTIAGCALIYGGTWLANFLVSYYKPCS